MNSKQRIININKEYRLIKKQGEGTFSEVFKAQSLKTGAFVAIKCMKAKYASNEQVNRLREVRALKRLYTHNNIINLMEVIYDELTGRLALVFELMDMNLYEAIKGKKTFLPEKKVKTWMYQVLKALDFMHRNGIFHRDIKPENILIKDDLIKLADLGSCKGIYSKPPFTEYISTRWYRSPECLLTDGFYNFKMDIWGVGCVFFELLSLFPLFPGDDEIDQVQKIHNILGSPSPDLFNKLIKNSSRNDIVLEKKQGIGIKRFLGHVSSECVDLISKLLIYDPEERYTSKQALTHPYFKDLVEQEMKLTKKTLNNYKQNTLLMMSFNHNDSMSFIKGDESQLYSRPLKKKDTIGITILPQIKDNYDNFNSNNNSSNQNLEDSGCLDNSKRNIATFLRLPKIKEIKNKFDKDQNFNHINEFKNSMKQNRSNHSIELNNNNTQYSKKPNNYNVKIKHHLQEIKKNYISPYSKKTIANNIQIY